MQANVRNVTKVLTLLLIAVVLASCGRVDPTATFEPLKIGSSAELSLAWALRGEVVDVKLLGANAGDLKSVTVGGVPAVVTLGEGNKFWFPVPAGTPAGRQQVVIKVDEVVLNYPLEVLGDDVVDREFLIVVAPGTTESELAAALEGIEYEILEGPQSLGLDSGPCAGDRVKLSISGANVGAALTELKGRTGIGPIWQSDPQSGYSSGAVDHLGAVGGLAPRLRNVTGSGAVVAVLDTGVSDHAELDFRLLTGLGYDFVDEGTTPLDEFPQGHGTPIAVLAAGSVSGVAPQAQVLPVRVCDEWGVCYSDDVLAGICHALATAESQLGGMDRLVLNLSLGGETPVESIREALVFAVENGALVAASGGNDGENGSAAQYPAAFDLDGVLAVAALQASPTDELLGRWSPAPFSTRGNYLDIAAPGADLRSGSPDGLYGTGYTGTSYATGIVAGALALWRESNSTWSPAEIESGLTAAAKPLPYPTNAVGAGMLDLSVEPQ